MVAVMLTEEQAKERWCPFARYSHQYEPAANRWKQVAPPEEPHALNPVPCRCIASQCMAWRISGDMVLQLPGDPGPVQFKTMGEFRDALKNGAQEVGYCGMAGRPE